MTLSASAIGTAIGTVIKAAATAVGSLSLGQTIALGTVIGVAGYTAYVLIKHTKEKVKHAFNKKSKERTATEKILDQDIDDENIDSMSEEDLLNSDPADTIGLGDFMRSDRKKSKKSVRKNKSATLFDRVKELAEGKLDPEGYKKKKEKEERKKWSNAQWAEYYRDQMHRMNDSPEEYAKWKKTHVPMTDRRKYQKFRKEQSKREIRVSGETQFPFETMSEPFDIEKFDKRVVRNDKWEREKYRRHKNKPLSEIPFNMLDYR